MKENNIPRIYVLHENEAWVTPLFEFLDELGAPYENWFINEGTVDLNSIPPHGIFYNRMSASSHSRNHRYAIELAESILAWLEAHNRKVINDRRALTLEVRKAEQLIALQKFGLKTPASIVVNNSKKLLDAAKKLGKFPFIVKPNRGGKGLGVKRYDRLEQLEHDILLRELPETLDGIWLVQEYIQPANGRITRAELIGGSFYYEVSIDATGGFELCPADACNVEDLFCPANAEEGTDTLTEKFVIKKVHNNPDISRYESFFASTGIKIGAIEYVQATDGERYIYDINTNTNYNSKAELRLDNDLQGMRRIAEYLNYELITAYYQNRIRVA